MAFRHHELTALISARPAEARVEILGVLRRVGCNRAAAADVWGVVPKTVYRWIARLDLGEEVAALEREAAEGGWRHDGQRQSPGRPKKARTSAHA